MYRQTDRDRERALSAERWHAGHKELKASRAKSRHGPGATQEREQAPPHPGPAVRQTAMQSIKTHTHT